jgi:glycosyltransferase involved in cell wall biosynthesis
MNFLIIIPLLRAEPYLDLCLSSILSQQGDFVLRVHIQTADQSGDVQRQVSRWQQRLQTFEPKSGRRQLTITAESDSGTYDAIARGVDGIGPADDWIMSWLGADDILLPGALMTLQSLITEHPQIRWITGLPFDHRLMDQIIRLHHRRISRVQSRRGFMAVGFVMQEGTFWRASLWRGPAESIKNALCCRLGFVAAVRPSRTALYADFSARKILTARGSYPRICRVSRDDSTLMRTKQEDLRARLPHFMLPGIGANRWTITGTRIPRRMVGHARRTGTLLVGMPLVTIAMVVRNTVEAFTDTFRSIEQQTYPNIEIIVIDGGSTDGTLELIRERESRIARWISEPDKGPYDGMNKAARLANGRWILFMNAGDFFYTPEAIEIALNGAPEKADFIIGHHIYRSIEGVDELHKASDFEDTWGTLTAGQLSFRWLSGVPCHQATFTRTSMLREGEYDYQKYPIAADHEFMYRMRSRGIFLSLR